MIDLRKICESAAQENVDIFIKKVSNAPNVSEDESTARVYAALMRHSELVLDKYHAALKEELKKHGIEI